MTGRMEDLKEDGGDDTLNNPVSNKLTNDERNCKRKTNDGEDMALPSSSHMSNSKFDQLDYENDVGDEDSMKSSQFDSGDEPPRKKFRELISIESKRNMTDQDKFDLEIIDDIEGDEDEDDSKLEDSDGEYVDDNEIYAWLEEGINKQSVASEGNDQEPVLREKVVLKELCHDPFNIIPEGWVVVTHNCGMPVYLHKDSRVVTLSQPYFLGPDSVRKHNIPLSAIPCLHYRRCLDKIETEEDTSRSELNTDDHHKISSNADSAEMTVRCPNSMKNSPPSDKNLHFKAEPACNSSLTNDLQVCDDSIECCDKTTSETATHSNNSSHKENCDGNIKNEAQINNEMSGEKIKNNVVEGSNVVSDNRTNGKGCPSVNFPAVKVESAGQRMKESSLDAQEVRKYCEKLFQFKTITVRKYKTWRERRRHFLQMKKQSRPELPMNTKLITCPLPNTNKPGEKGGKRKDFVLNPSGKSHVCILHEYVQHTMRVQPRYVFKELENAATPYSARVIIEDVEYGVGYASSKKAAKLEAAKNTLKILIPEMNKMDNEDKKTLDDDFSFFDNIKIEDPRVFELGTKAGHQSPNQILCECLRRNYGLGDTHCEMTMRKIKNQKSEFTMTVGKHTATVIAKNKRDGKQQAAQAILQKLHSHVTSWGSILRLYGRGSQKGFAEKKDDLNISELQSQAKANRSSNPILEKLKEEMHKLHECKVAVKSKGKLRVESTELPLKVPNLDL